MKVNTEIWTDAEKLQLADAIDMYGIREPERLAECVPTKKHQQVDTMIRKLQLDNRKEAECYDMTNLSFVNLNTMDDLFLIGGTKPKDVLIKWMEYLESFYLQDAYKYDKFKLFSRAFLIMSECLPKPEVSGDQDAINFR